MFFITIRYKQIKLLVNVKNILQKEWPPTVFYRIKRKKTGITGFNINADLDLTTFKKLSNLLHAQ
jgi:hypothetical protein